MNKRVLIFDDETDIVMVIKLLLEEHLYEVEYRLEVDHLLPVVRDFKPQLIFMDHWIPTMGGIDATRLLRSKPECAGIPVVYISSNPELQVVAEQAGAEAVLAKPFENQQLLELVKSLIGPAE